MKTKSTILVLVLCLLTAGCGSLGEPQRPTLNALVPATGIVGSSDLNLLLLGTGFTDTSSVIINGTVVSSTLVNRFNLRTTISASLLDTPSLLNVLVSNEQATSSSKIFTILSVGEVSSTNNPQVAQYSFTSPRDAQVTIEFGPDTNYELKTWARPTPNGGGQVDILVAGMRAFTTYHMRATVQFPDGVTHFDSDHTFTTGGLLPEQIPSLSVSQSGTPMPGVQLLNLLRGEPRIMALVTDLEGNVIWFYEVLPGHTPFPIQFLSNGNFLVVDSFAGSNILLEIDLAGNTIRETNSFKVNQALLQKGIEPVLGQFHHDAIMLPNGHFVMLMQHTKVFTNLVGFEGQDIPVVGDSLVELDENLEPVWFWSSFDHLDVNRHPMFFAAPQAFDWTHGNAVTYSPADGNLLLSLRHQHWILKIDFQDGFGSSNVLWRLGLEGDFTLLNGGSADWQYAQHFPFIVDNQIGFFRLAVFDNGNNRVVDQNGNVCVLAPAEIKAEANFFLTIAGNSTAPRVESKALITSGTPCFSRAVIFEIDEVMKTTRVVWEDKLPTFAPFIGSIQVLDNGNVLWDAGTVAGTRNAIIREVTQENDPHVVWQLDVSEQFAYRSLRLPSLYPGVQW